MIYFLQTDYDIIVIRILSQHQDAGRHLNWQGYRGVPGQNSRSASSSSLLPSPFWFDPVCPGITPILPKTVKQPSARAITGFMEDLSRKRILYAFGFSRNNA